MISKEAFDLYYEKELKGIVASLEARRLNIGDRFSYKRYKRNIKWLFLIDVMIGLLIGFDVIPVGLGALVPFTIMYAMFAPLYIFIRRNWAFDPINKVYKAEVIPKIISFLDPGLKYEPEHGISLSDLKQSGLFEAPTGFKSEDLVHGEVDGFSLMLSDVHMSRRERNKVGEDSSTSHQVIRGLYAIVKLSSKTPSRVIIRQNSVARNAVNQLVSRFLGDSLADKIEERLQAGSLKTNNEAFDKDFDVTCEEEAVARQLLSPLLMQLLLALKVEVASQVLLSVFDDQLHIAYLDVDLFEGDAHRSFVENDVSKKYFMYLSTVLGVAQAVQAVRQDKNIVS
jgi:hypothetical protein